MKRMGGWLHARPNPQSTSRSMTALDEQNALQDALASAALIMNDEIERAEEELSRGTSPFHKSGVATATFLRAALGFEKDVMELASSRLSEAEEAAAEYQRRAIRNPSTAHHSEIYPPGSEYALCHAESQLMSAVIGVLNESLTESLRGFYKLRKAFATLSEISESEKRSLKARSGISSVSRPSTASSLPSSRLRNYDSSGEKSGLTNSSSSDDEDDLEFVDAKDDWSQPSTPDVYNGHLDYPEVASTTLPENLAQDLNRRLSLSAQPAAVDAASEPAAQSAESEIDFRSLTSDPIDLFIHSGTSLCFGLLQLMLSMIPPAFAKLLSIFSFTGNRDEGLRMLWSATRFKHNINGAMAGLITLGFHNGAIAFCDILPRDALPEERLRGLLREMRDLYPKSKLWLLEESRMLARDRKLEDAVAAVLQGPKSGLKQVEALGIFEMSLNLLYLHRYEECAESFIKCVGLNNWSHALYYYIAGICYVELYRIHASSSTRADQEKAKSYATKAEKYLHEVPSHAGKRRFMARQLPFDVFVSRKIQKWEERMRDRGCSFVDAVGVSPVVEMIYFWPGYRRMRAEQIEKGLERLKWSENAETNPGWKDEAVDEKAILHFLRGVSYRNLGRLEKAKTTLRDDVLSHCLHELKACPHADTWTLPAAHYELAVCHWQEAGGEDGDKALLEKCRSDLTTVSKWESFDLEARIGMKVTTGLATLRKAGVGT